MRISVRILIYALGLLCSAGEEVVRLQELEGNTVTIHTGLTGVQSHQIMSISREDSGVYTLQISSKSVSAWSFSVDVYAPVSKPVIKNQFEKYSVSHRDLCFLLCSVENGKDLSLSWYEEKERISSISSSDSSERLYLPLNKTNPDCSTYTCVAANPVSTQTAQLNITGHYHHSAEFVVRLVLSAVVVLATISILLYHFTSKRNVVKRKFHH
ncbi:hypothetical protein SRHO_G00254220 [Serrasalmus rhombeus]